MSIRIWVAGSVAVLVGGIGACSIDDRLLTTATLGIQPGADASMAGSPGASGSGGDGTGAGVLSVEPPSFDFGPAVIGVPSRTRVAILNSGDGALAAVSAALAAGSDPDYQVLLNGCENGIAPSERCDIRLQLVTSKEGASAATLEVESSGQPAQVPLAGSGVAPGPLTLAPAAGSSADFGGVVLSAAAEMSFDVSNPTPDSSGPLALSVNDPQLQLLPPAGADCQPGVTALANGQRCSVRVAFSPVRRGAVEASLVVSSALGGSSLPLAGVGNAPGTLSAPPSVDFGGVVLGGTARRTLRIQNAGDEALVLGGVALAGATAAAPASGSADAGPLARAQAPAPGSNEAFSIQNSDCGAGMVLAGGQACTLTVGFRPLVAAASQQTQLVVGAANGTATQIALAGSGLNEGALTVAPVDGSATQFGDLLVGQSQTLDFVISNPSAQLSGPLQFVTSDDFAALPPAAAGDCESGVTSLVNGQSCVIHVGFTPSARGPRDGSLLVSSALAGSVHQPLSGRGLAAGEIALSRAELDFGRVPTETPVQQTLTIANDGDQPIGSVQATLEAPGGGAAQGFTLQGACAGAVTAAAPCQLVVQFSPLEASTYAAVLRVTGTSAPGADTGSSGGSSVASALLLGRAFPRGSLVLTPSAGATDFGDVVLGSSSTLSFTLANPGSVASGRLTLATSNNAFTVSEGDCNAEGSAGLIDGSSCTFEVSFTPTTSEALDVNLSVQSPGAGETALSLSGRGRTAPSLTATGNRDFGSANVNEQALTNPTNQFTWTVTNDGDLDSGPLAIENTNAAEFIVSNDTCANVPVVGHGTCTMDIRFLPSSGGARSSSLTVTDTVSSQTLVLAMTGNGIVIAGPGESCVNATCSTGVCTGGVCCDRACVGSCQVCSAAGVCTNQAERQACGDGSGVCFGVDQCLLPELQACSGDDQCGSGNCERRLGGRGPADSICCLDDCGLTGQQCNPQTGRCQVPALGAGEACGAAGQPACGAGLECKPCLTGGSQCTPPDGCCGGCQGEQVCTGGECACPTPPGGGLQQIHCGGGRCIPNVAGACCDTTTGCDGQLQCNAATDLCACPAGSRECNAGSGQCLPNAQCCNCGGPCNTCNNGQCLPVGNGQQGACAAGEVCQNGNCAPLQDVQLGELCNQTANNCANGSCVQGRCACSGNAPKACGNFCIGANECCGECPNGTVCQAGNCAPLAPVGLGEACNRQANNCTAGTCNAQGICAECEGNGVIGCPEFGGSEELVCNGGIIERRSCPTGEGCGANDPGCTDQLCPPRSLFACNATGTARLFCADNGRDISETPCPDDRPFCDSTVREVAPGSPVACQPCFTDQDCIDRGAGTTCNPPNTFASSTLTLNTCD